MLLASSSKGLRDTHVQLLTKYTAWLKLRDTCPVRRGSKAVNAALMLCRKMVIPMNSVRQSEFDLQAGKSRGWRVDRQEPG